MIANIDEIGETVGGGGDNMGGGAVTAKPLLSILIPELGKRQQRRL